MTRLPAFVAACAALLHGAAVVHADCPANQTFIVTNVYDFNGVPGPELYLTVGYTYTFDLRSPAGHPFYLTFDSIGGPGTSPLPLSTGVSCVCSGCNTCSTRTITFTPVASLAGQTVFYQCTVHFALGNLIRILPQPAITVNTLPQPVQRCGGGTEDAQFTVSATSNEVDQQTGVTATVSYQWQRNGQPVANIPGHIAGATSSALLITGVTADDAGSYSCVLTAPCKTVTTAGAALTVANCCPADIGISGGLPGSDGQLDNNDFIAFIDFFFESDAQADRGSAGGLPGADTLFDNNDFIVFINQFFAGC